MQVRQNSSRKEDTPSIMSPMPLESWCWCGRCMIMPNLKENSCCWSLKEASERRGEAACVTLVEGFEACCLNQEVLRMCMARDRISRSLPPGVRNPQNIDYRHNAYANFINWIFSHSSRPSVRIVIPSCCVLIIREHFPNPADVPYVGFCDMY